MHFRIRHTNKSLHHHFPQLGGGELRACLVLLINANRDT